MGLIINTGDNTYDSLRSEGEARISNVKRSRALKYHVAFEIRAHKLSALKTYRKVIDLEAELTPVCLLAIGAVNM